jgi:xanthine dehydrogenase YagS FAD-binding subunit
MNSFDLLRPKTLADAVKLVAGEDPPTLKAGGIDLLDRMKEGLERPARLLDLLPLAELRGIEEKDGNIRIGALTTLAEVAASPLIREKAAALAEAAQEAATPQVRAQATVGGNLFQHTRCWYYRNADFEPCSLRGGKECFAKEGRNKIHAIFDTEKDCVAVDPSSLAPALDVLHAGYETRLLKDGAKVLVEGASPRVHGRNTAGPSFGRGKLILTNVFVRVESRRSAYREFKERESFDWALVSTAVSFGWKDGACIEPRIALGAVSLEGRRCEAAEKMLHGQKLTPELARSVAEKALEGAAPLAENGYKVPVARALVTRALLAAAGMEEKR